MSNAAPDADLADRRTPLEGDGDFLHLSQVHLVERVLRAVFRQVELEGALVGAVFELVARYISKGRIAHRLQRGLVTRTEMVRIAAGLGRRRWRFT